jgi:hypothetical protein
MLLRLLDASRRKGNPAGGRGATESYLRRKAESAGTYSSAAGWLYEAILRCDCKETMPRRHDTKGNRHAARRGADV